jgi:hypothetical protein
MIIQNIVHNQDLGIARLFARIARANIFAKGSAQALFVQALFVQALFVQALFAQRHCEYTSNSQCPGAGNSHGLGENQP